MGTWTTKFRKPAVIAGVLAIGLAAGNPALAENKGSKRGTAGLVSGAAIGAAAGGPIGAFVGASVGFVMGDRSHKKNEVLATRKAEAALLAGEVEALELSLTSMEGKAGEVGATVQFRTGETQVRDNDRARLAKLGALLSDLDGIKVRVSGFADARGGEEINQVLSQERAESVALELEKAGIPRERLIVEAMGERFASTEAMPDDQAFERCVEIRLESTTAVARN